VLIRQIDHSFILLHLRELAHMHSACFDESAMWHEHWTDYPTPGQPDSLSYLLDAAARDSYWAAAIDDDGEVLGEPDRVLACGIVERLGSDHADELGIDIRGKEGDIFYNVVYFHHLEAAGMGLAHALIDRRIYIAKDLGGKELWTRTRKDHVQMDRLLKEFGFVAMAEETVMEAEVASVRVRYRKALS
jgi:GNAT superfamily N-acetyltransferase